MYLQLYNHMAAILIREISEITIDQKDHKN